MDPQELLRLDEQMVCQCTVLELQLGMETRESATLPFRSMRLERTDVEYDLATVVCEGSLRDDLISRQTRLITLLNLK